MINVTKSQPAPECLAIEKAKGKYSNGISKGTYNCGDVLFRLKTDFRNKCYLCESKGLTTLNTEHFVPHQGNIHLEFDWDNLFFVCGHCNNTKLAKFIELLNCTDLTQRITELIQFKVTGIPKEHFEITATEQMPTIEAQNTVALLNAIYKGTTKLKEIESENLRDNVTKEVAAFTQYFHDFYYTDGLTEEEKKALETKIRRKLSPESSFTAFKIWVIKSNPRLLKDFGYLLN